MNAHHEDTLYRFAIGQYDSRRARRIALRAAAQPNTPRIGEIARGALRRAGAGSYWY